MFLRTAERTQSKVPTAYALLRRAISQRLQVHATYGGLVREVCPHVLGHGEDGQALVLVYQFGGDTKDRPLEPDGSPENWRCLRVAELRDVALIEGPWHSARNYSRTTQSCVHEIDAAV